MPSHTQSKRRARRMLPSSFEQLENRWVMAASLSLSGPTSVVYEGDRAQFTLTLSEPLRSPERVFITTSPGTATFGRDYFAPTQTQLLFAPGQTQQTFSISTLREAVSQVEGIETFQVIATPANRSLGARTATVRIDDSLPPPLIRVNDVSVVEGNSGTTPVTFQVTLSAPNNRPISVDYATRAGTATVADNDYASVTGAVTFAPGEVTKNVTVNVTGDRKLESDETFSLVLTPPAYGTVARGGGTATIRNDETDQPGFQITVNYIGTVRQSIRDACTWAAQRWAQVIIGDLPSVFDPARGLIDDFRIDVQEGLLGGGQNGTGGTLANAGPLLYRNDASGLPWLGEAGIDPFDASDPQLRNIILHEFGHAMGFGTMWIGKGLAQGIGTTSPIYVGPNAVREYSRIFNTSATSIPIENQTQGAPGTPGDGSYGAHWRESLMTNELMTSASEPPGVAMPLSSITVGAMQDLGYEVRYAAADAYQPATPFPPVPPVTVPSWSVQDFRIVEGNAGPNVAFFNFVLTFPRNFVYSGPIGVTFSLQDGTATGGELPPSDYLRVQSAGVRFTTDGPVPQQAIVPAIITIFGDTRPEPDETLFVVLTNPTNGSTIVTPRATATIVDDDSTGAVLAAKAGRPNSLLVSASSPNSPRSFPSLNTTSPAPIPQLQLTGIHVPVAPARSGGLQSAASPALATKAAGTAQAALIAASQPRPAEPLTKATVALAVLRPTKSTAPSRLAAFASLALR